MARGFITIVTRCNDCELIKSFFYQEKVWLVWRRVRWNNFQAPEIIEIGAIDTWTTFS